MGSSPRAHLAYGFDLGTAEDFKAAQRGKYGQPDVPWAPDEMWAYTFADALVKQLPDPTVIGVEFSGAEDSTGWMLVVKDSKRTVDWTDALVLDLAAMNARPLDEGWVGALYVAVETLGITPTQDGPKWLVFPSYG
jgi:hypothetical protein